MKIKMDIKYILPAALIAVNIILSIFTARAMSPTYDEPIHLAAGYSYWKTGDYRANAFDHPPFAEMWAAVPVLFMKPVLYTTHPYWTEIRKYQYPFSDLFLYHNRVDAEKMLNSARFMVTLLSCMLGLVIFLWAQGLFGYRQGILAMALWSFSSAFIAHGSIVSTDMAMTLFYFSTVYMLWLWHKNADSTLKERIKTTLLLGLSLGLLLASKYSAAVIFPAAGLILILNIQSGKTNMKEALRMAAAVFLTALIVLLIVYQFNSLLIYYWLGMKRIFGIVASGRSSFLMGSYSTRGWIYYFPAVFLLKTPIPFIILLISAVFAKKLRSGEILLYLLWPAMFYFMLACFSKMQIGHRHILPVYPFLTVWVSGLYSPGMDRKFKYGIYMLVFLYVFSALKAHPWHLSYFNESIGNNDNGYKYLTDSNVDWGQGLKELAIYLKKENVPGIYLCYFGTGDPGYYGIKYVPVGFIDNISPPWTENERAGDDITFEPGQRALLAVSASNLQATYYADKNAFGFLKNIPSEKIIARSILVYDLDKYPGAKEGLSGLLDAGRKTFHKE